MFLNAMALEKLTLKAKDGEMGKVKDLYFDDVDYTVRYLTVESKKWFPGQVIYLSPSAIQRVDFDRQVIEVNHTRSELREHAGVKQEKDFKPEKEEEIATRLNWNTYWAGDERWGRYATPKGAGSEDATDANNSSSPSPRRERLRSVNHMKGRFNHADVMAEDGEAGNVFDVIIEEDSWRIRYFLINCGSWSTHNFVPISPDWIAFADWEHDKLHLDMTLNAIENSPMYEKRDPITRDFEEKLYKRFNKEPYWK